MFPSPSIIKIWVISDTDCIETIIPLSLNSNIVDIKADDENVMIRTIKLRKMQQQNSFDKEETKNCSNQAQIGVGATKE